MASVADLTAGIVAADKAGNKADAEAFAAELKAHPDYRPAGGGGLVKALGSFGRGAADLGAGFAKGVINPALAPTDFIGDAVTGNWGSNRRRGEAIDKFAKEYGANDWTSVVNQAAPEVVVTGGPLAMVEKKVAGAVANRLLPKATEKAAEVATKVPLRARAAGFAADTGVNAAYSGAQAAAAGEDPLEAAARAAMISAGVRTGLKAVAAPFKKGASQAIDHNAKVLQDAGLPVPPGLLYPKTWVGGVENSLKHLPLIGGAVEDAQGRLGREYIRQYAQDIADTLQRVVPGEVRPTPRRGAAGAAAGAVPEGAPGLPATLAAQRAARGAGRDIEPSTMEPYYQRDRLGHTGREIEPGVPPRTGEVGAPTTPPRQWDTIDEAAPPHPYDDMGVPPGPSRGTDPGADTLEQTFRLEPRVGKVEGESLDLTRNLKNHIDDSYEDVVHHTFMRAPDAMSALQYASRDLNNISWLTEQQRGMVADFINDRLVKKVNEVGPNGLMSGREVKNLDSMLGKEARRWLDDPTTRPMAEAVYAIQHRLRVATQGTTKEARTALSLSNDAFRKALPLMRATEQALGSTGVPSAKQLRKAMQHYDMEPDALNHAMSMVAPNAPTNNQTSRRWVGTASGLTGLVAAGLPATVAIGAGMSMGSKAAYSPAGVNAQIKLLGLPAGVANWLKKQPSPIQTKYLNSLRETTNRSLSDDMKYLPSIAGQSARAIGDNQGE